MLLWDVNYFLCVYSGPACVQFSANSHFEMILNCHRPDSSWLNCITRSYQFLSFWTRSPVLTSLHHLQDEQLMLRTDRESILPVSKALRSNLLAGPASTMLFLSNINRVTEGAVEQCGYVTKIRLLLFSPAMYRNPSCTSPMNDWLHVLCQPKPIWKCNRTWL